jgi:integrase
MALPSLKGATQMASLQLKGDSWYCQFIYRKERYTFTVGKVEEIEARAVKAKVEYILMRLKQNLLDVPAGLNIVTFIHYDGKPPPAVLAAAPLPKETPFSEFRDSFLKTFGNGAVDENTLYTEKIHLAHLATTLGEKFPMNALTLSDLQRHVDRRQKDVAGTTIKKEIDTLRSAWNWASRMGHVEGNFPGGKLIYPKGEDKLPFMTWQEIERRLAAGGDPDELWECLYLTTPETVELLDFVKGRKVTEWIYSGFLFIAHTGARRSEMIRATPQDVDLAAGIVTIREKKRVKGRRTTRRVPLSTRLAEALKDRLEQNQGQAFLFGPGDKAISPQGAQQAFERASRGSKWAVMKGWHVLRHFFISALASRGVDQRIIDDLVGHSTEEQRRRYRHLYPSTTADAIKLVFG